MNLAKVIQDAIKTNKAIVGYRESIKHLKLNRAELIVLAKNSPEKIKKEIEHIAKVENIKLEIVEESKELGVMCGKPFPVTVVVIKG
ncbi:MAG: ribosomal L7Ae/L30e/S12e/Gadd45 family protein [Candidatus Aenigmarchaeota archaeon]|nr:ribosomal L7Ae/L30e/S12e/Gadd45 family protein [Candidatus Aenigmarchaeota archaeon]